MSTYFNIVNLDKKEQAILVLVTGQEYINHEISKWENEHGSKWERVDSAPGGWELQSNGKWHSEIKPYFHYSQKKVFGFIFWSACTDAWGVTSSWYGDRVVIIDDNKSSIRTDLEWYEISETYKKVKFYVSNDEWMNNLPY